MSTPALRVNGVSMARQSAPPYAGNGGVLWSDGDALHWTTPSGRDLELPRVTGSQLLAVDDLDGVLRAQVEGYVVAGAMGGASVLAALLLVRLGYWLLRKVQTAAWIARQPKREQGPYRGE